MVLNKQEKTEYTLLSLLKYLDLEEQSELKNQGITLVVI
jgi:hypothetical protein